MLMTKRKLTVSWYTYCHIKQTHNNYDKLTSGKKHPASEIVITSYAVTKCTDVSSASSALPFVIKAKDAKDATRMSNQNWINSKFTIVCD